MVYLQTQYPLAQIRTERYKYGACEPTREASSHNDVDSIEIIDMEYPVWLDGDAGSASESKYP